MGRPKHDIMNKLAIVASICDKALIKNHVDIGMVKAIRDSIFVVAELLNNEECDIEIIPDVNLADIIWPIIRYVCVNNAININLKFCPSNVSKFVFKRGRAKDFEHFFVKLWTICIESCDSLSTITVTLHNNNRIHIEASCSFNINIPAQLQYVTEKNGWCMDVGRSSIDLTLS